MNRETPTLIGTSYANSSLGGSDFTLNHATEQLRMPATQLHYQNLLQQVTDAQNPPTPKPQEIIMSAARIVKIFIADPNENIALEKRVLYTGDEKLTDLTDQELFFEVPIADMLSKHNAERAKTIDKTQAAKFGRDIFLEPAKIRDLKMVVVTVATF